MDDSDQWIAHPMVVHAFSLLNEVIWKGSNTIISATDKYMEFNTIEEVSYNTKSKRGVLIGNPYSDPITNVTT